MANLENNQAVSDTAPSALPSTLIIHSSLMRPSFTEYLGPNVKTRESDVIPRDSIILPRSAVAILLVYVSNVERQPSGAETPVPGASDQLESLDDLAKRLESLYKNHQSTIVIMISPVFGEEEIDMITSQLLLRLLPRSPLFLLAHGEAQAACHVQLIAKATTVEAKRLIRARISAGIQRTLDQDPPNMLTSVLGLSDHDASVLMDTYGGSLMAIASATADELHDATPLDRSTAEAIFNFFDKDTILP